MVDPRGALILIDLSISVCISMFSMLPMWSPGGGAAGTYMYMMAAKWEEEEEEEEVVGYMGIQEWERKR